jgi:hypothetical protein
MTRWTLPVGDYELVIEKQDDGQVRIEIPSGRPLLASRLEVEAIRLRLGAALGHDESTLGAT